MSEVSYDHEVDVLVVGSGNGALTAAVCNHAMGTKSVLVVEKSDKYGGSSARSGGGIWVPCSRYAKAAGAEDSYEDAFRYVKAVTPEDRFREDMVSTYLKNAPKMLDFLYDNSQVRYESLPIYPDYHTYLPGSRPGHRSHEPATVSGKVLAEHFDDLEPNGGLIGGRYMFKQTDMRTVSFTKWKRSFLFLRLGIVYWLDIFWWLKHKPTRWLTMGAAGVARLFGSMLDRNISIWLSSPMEELIVEGGRVVGAVVTHEGVTKRVKANKAVVLGAGGFEHNQEMRDQYLPKPTKAAWSIGTTHNTGDGIRAGQKIGAQTALMDGAWWCNTQETPGDAYPLLQLALRGYPGSIVVNREGKRYINEAIDYVTTGNKFYGQIAEGADLDPSYIIFDANFKTTFPIFPFIGPDSLVPKELFESGAVARGESLRELAEKLDINPDGLEQTVTQFNEYAAEGRDRDFGRGDSVYENYFGDPRVEPNCNLGPIQQGPYYAIRSDQGDMGTHGGLLTDPNGQVVHENGEPIVGLYAVGNCCAAVLPAYAGPGSTLGPAMTFAYQAAKHINNHEG